MSHQTENKQQKAGSQKDQSELVVLGMASGGGCCGGSVESFASASGNVCCGTGMAVGQVTGPKAEVLVVVDASDVDGMHGSTPVSSGRRGGPGNDLGLTAVNRQPEASFDFVNLLPAECCSEQRVDDGDALIENHNVGLDEQQPAQNPDGQDGAHLGEPGSVAVGQNLHEKKHADGHGKCCQNNSASRSEFNRIGHSTILPPLQIATTPEGK